MLLFDSHFFSLLLGLQECQIMKGKTTDDKSSLNLSERAQLNPRNFIT